MTSTESIRIYSIFTTSCAGSMELTSAPLGQMEVSTVAPEQYH